MSLSPGAADGLGEKYPGNAPFRFVVTAAKATSVTELL